ncbi:MAG: urocanate hydratase, partial [Cyclobacteriaceae bacterium]
MAKTEIFREQILEGIPDVLPSPSEFDNVVSHAQRRKNIITQEEKRLAISNALRYFHPRHHEVLAPEFYDELQKFGRIYMYR